jgi:hypothetical protein
MVSMSDERKEGNILKLILMVRFACATPDVRHHTHLSGVLRESISPEKVRDHRLGWPRLPCGRNHQYDQAEVAVYVTGIQYYAAESSVHSRFSFRTVFDTK